MAPSDEIWSASPDPWFHKHLDKNQKENNDFFEDGEEDTQEGTSWS